MLMARHRNFVISSSRGLAMKKNRDADELAARITAAANQPAVVVSAPIVALPEAGSAQELPRRKSVRARVKRQATDEEDDTVAISLRPGRALLHRYTLAAAERTRETGRVISAQQIMLEILERWP
jgi:hypothetical protein